MKLIALILITAFATKVSAQQPKIGIDLENKFKNNITSPIDSLNNLIERNNYSPFSVTKEKLSYTLANGDKVFLLPEDHMSCIVTDISQYNYNMPVYKGKINGTIPNASPPLQIIPKKEIR
jgi:hypothetical protein